MKVCVWGGGVGGWGSGVGDFYTNNSSFYSRFHGYQTGRECSFSAIVVTRTLISSPPKPFFCLQRKSRLRADVACAVTVFSERTHLRKEIFYLKTRSIQFSHCAIDAGNYD